MHAPCEPCSKQPASMRMPLHDHPCPHKQAPQIPSQLKIATIEDSDSDDDHPANRNSKASTLDSSILPTASNLGIDASASGRTSPR